MNRPTGVPERIWDAMSLYEKRLLTSGIDDVTVVIPTGSWMFDPEGAAERNAGFDFLCFVDQDKITSMERRVTWNEKGRLWNQVTSDLGIVAFRHTAADLLLLLCCDSDILEWLTGAHHVILEHPEKFSDKRKRNAYLSRIAHHGDGRKHGIVVGAKGGQS